MVVPRPPALARSGLQIVPMLVEKGADPAAARRMLAEHGLDGLGGPATEILQDALAFVLADTLVDSEELPLPCSFLLDRKGQLCALYVGEIRFRDLASDLDMMNRLPDGDLLNPRPLGGRLLIPRVRNFDKLSKQFRRLGLEDLAAACEAKVSEVNAKLAPER